MIVQQIFTTLLIASILRANAVATGPRQPPAPTQPTEESNSAEDEIFATSYVLPKQIYNDGIPYYVEKDAVSGQFDFSSKKPAGIEVSVNEVIDPKEKIVLSSAAPNIHDILHLPVKYTSSKFVYPLVSSSYANLKYQGNNKNYISSNQVQPTKINSTKLQPHPAYTNNIMTIPPTSPTIPTTQSTTKRTTTSTTSTTTTTKRPTTTTKIPITTPRPTTTTTITTTPVPKPQPTRPFVFETSTERKKFYPTKKFHPASTHSTTVHQQLPTSTPTFFELEYGMKTSPRNPVVFNSSPAPLPKVPFKPLPITTTTSTQIPILDPADIYNAMVTEQEHSKIFSNSKLNSISLTDNQISDDSEGDESYPVKPENANNGFDVHGNLMQPLEPSKPSPFKFQSTTIRNIPSQPNGQAYQQGRPIEEQDFYKIRPTQGSYEPQITGNGYVSFHVPNMKPTKPPPVIHQVPVVTPGSSVNNVVISPEQNSASFVLGSRQQTVGKPLNDKNGRPIQYGQVINEDISTIPRPQMVIQSQPERTNVQGQVFTDSVVDAPSNQGNQETKDVLVTTNIRFPSEEHIPEQSNKSPSINGHAQPLSLHQLKQQANKPSVVFPKSDEKPTEISSTTATEPSNKVIFEEDDKMIQRQEIVPLGQFQTMQQKLKFPDISEDLTPPHKKVTQDPRPQDLNNRQGPLRTPPPGFKFMDIRKQQLPNILPQFRPNSNGNSGPPFKDRMNVYPGTFPNRMLPPQFTPAQRRTPPANRYQPPPPQTPPQEANRRVYRPPGNGQNQYHDTRLFYRRPQHYSTAPKQHNIPPPAVPYQGAPQGFPGKIKLPQLRNSEYFSTERNTRNSAGPASERYPPETSLGLEKLPIFEEEDIMVNDPPKPATINKKNDEQELEPVVTLQMLKTKKNSSPVKVEETKKEPIKFDYEVIGPSQGLYVVYPHKGGAAPPPGPPQLEDMNVPAESRHPPPAIVSFEASGSGPGADYQNTPFSVIRDSKQEPILMAKPQKVVQQQKPKEEFPYRLEKPSLQDLGRVKEIDNVVLNMGSLGERVAIADTPIAIAYSPTESNPYNQRRPSNPAFSNPNTASQVIPEIREEYEYELDSRGQNYEKDFMAPFYPSMSLNSVTPNGWSYEVTNAPEPVPSVTPSVDVQEKNNIDRSDKVETEVKVDKPVAQALVSEGKMDSFSPQLQGGFKPIYPPGYNMAGVNESMPSSNPGLSLAPSGSGYDDTTNGDDIITTTTTTNSPATITTTVTTTKLKPEKKKEASLVDILFGSDDDEDEQEQDS